MAVAAAMIKLLNMPRGMLMELSFHAFLRFSKKCPCGSALKPPCRSALVRDALTISI